MSTRRSQPYAKTPPKGKHLPPPERIRESSPKELYRFDICPQAPLPAPWNKRVQVQLAGDPLADLSPNVNPAGSMKSPRASMMKKARLKKEWQLAMEKAWRLDGAPKFTVPVEIQIHVFRKRDLDPDNALAGLKGVIDGITGRALSRRAGESQEGLIPDDSAKWVRYAPVMQYCKQVDALNPNILLVVTPQEEIDSKKAAEAACLEGGAEG